MVVFGYHFLVALYSSSTNLDLFQGPSSLKVLKLKIMFLSTFSFDQVQALLFTYEQDHTYIGINLSVSFWDESKGNKLTYLLP